MKLFLITFDGQPEYIEAPSMMKAIEIWHAHFKETDPDYTGDEEPEQCALVHDEPVIREKASA